MSSEALNFRGVKPNFEAAATLALRTIEICPDRVRCNGLGASQSMCDDDIFEALPATSVGVLMTGP